MTTNQHKRADEPLPKRAYTVPDACHVSSIGRTKLYDLINDGTLKTIKIGTRRLILADSLDALLGASEAA